MSTITAAMKAWEEDDNSNNNPYYPCPMTITLILEHKYCEANLSFQTLKNGDRALAEAMAQAKLILTFT